MMTDALALDRKTVKFGRKAIEDSGLRLRCAANHDEYFQSLSLSKIW